MKTHERRFVHGGALSPVLVTLGDLVRREANGLAVLGLRPLASAHHALKRWMVDTLCTARN
jgi:hypothetical protein